MTFFEPYTSLASAIGALTLLLIAQLLVADVIGILRKHTPGSLVESDHNDLLFRASRVVGNTNESIAIFILASLFCVMTSASPSLTGLAAWAYVGTRTAYALCYYANLQILRSVIFGLSLAAIATMFSAGVYRYF